MQHNSYGLFISLTLHLIILMIPVSIAVSKHFKEIELFVMDERPLQPVQKKVVKTKLKEPPEEIIKEVQPEPIMTEPEIKETPISNSQDAAPSAPLPAPLPPEPNSLPLIVTEQSTPLLDVEFGSEKAPQFLHRELPVYPLIARRLGKEGRVLLRLTIDEKGNLINIEVIEKADYGFTDAAIKAVKRSTFMPAKINGKPVTSRALLPIKFTLRRD